MTLLGHPPMTGDDVLQNYPLRVLVGTMLRHGSLPLWDPFIWSGAPLLAGSNAGAAYPAVGLFAVLPGPWAWTMNLVLVYGVAGSGFYWYLRSREHSGAAAFGGALAFAYSGFLTAQFVHLGLSQGVALVPLLMLAARRADQLRWAGGLGLVFGLIILTGEPRAVTIAVVVALLTMADEFWRGRHARLRYLAGSLGGCLIGLALAAVYWLPALADVYRSQRGHESYQFFTSGSLLPVWLLLLVLPYLLGAGSHLWQFFFGSYNLSELGGYPGMLALGAAAALVPSVLRRRRGWRELVFWYALLATGVVLALGGNTPLGHLLAALPVYGKMRLQSRNLAIVDLALAGLLAQWLDAKFALPRRADPLKWRSRARYLLPVLLLAALVAFVLTAPGVAAHWLRAPFPYFRSQWPYYSSALVLAAAGSALASQAQKFSRSARRNALLGFLVVDMGLAAAGVGWSGPTTAVLAGHSPDARAVAAMIPSGERFAIYDPWGSNPTELAVLGAPDLNVLRGQLSVQGYGSVVRRAYDVATGTHQQNSLSPAAFSSGALDRLGLGLLLAPTSAFVLPAGSGEPSAPQPVEAPLRVPARASAGRFVGPPVAISEVLLSAPGISLARPLTVTVVGPGGERYSFPAAFSDGLSAVRFRQPHLAVSLQVTNPNRKPVQVFGVDVLSGSTLLRLDGPLNADLRSRSWQYVRSIGGYAAYRNLRTGPEVRIAGGRAARLTDVRLDPPPWQVASLRVTSEGPVRVIRDVAYSPGWIVRARHPGSIGGSLTVPVRADGLVQSVQLPAGTWQLSYEYRPRLVMDGGLITLAGLLILALTALPESVRRRIHRTPRIGRGT